jgi:hypothetical protein
LIFIGSRFDVHRAGARIRPALGAARQGRKMAIRSESRHRVILDTVP